MVGIPLTVADNLTTPASCPSPAGIPVFGPSPAAALLEGSKSLSKDFMARHNIPTARFQSFTSSQHSEAQAYLKTFSVPPVIKASGLAGGKGVLIPETFEEASTALESVLVGKQFGSAGEEVVIEEFMTGPELSILAFSDGYTLRALPAAQDHKRIGEADTGLNTGGMGAYAPAPVATPEILDQCMKECLEPTLNGMRKDGFPFVGMLFTGFILTEEGPKVLEYNVRFGDPETEAVLLLLDDKTDLAEVMLACCERRLDSVTLGLTSGFAISVILASQGYPGKYPTGFPITFGEIPEGVKVFHAGTKSVNGQIVTDGGRVIAVCAAGETLEAAVELAYKGVAQVHFDGKTFRRDIAYRALGDSASKSTGLTYAAAGVSVDNGNALVEAIKPIVKATRRVGADGEIGGFGGAFDLKAAGFRDPVLVSGTDGVGTKLRVALDVGIHNTVGIDLVAMSVNDLIVQGAEPLYFLDYFACSKLDVKVAADVVAGIAEGCLQAGCALIGGETAEMPGMYHSDDYDLAGFAVGAVERELMLPQPNIQAGDVLIGLPSSGPHSNGFSLIRKVASVSGLTYASPAPWDASTTLGEALLTPTRIYIKQLLPGIRQGLFKAMSHITGGGFIENIPRVFPKGSTLGCTVDASTWSLPALWKWIMQTGQIEALEMARTFNMGVGMVIIVSKENVSEALKSIHESGEPGAFVMGEMVEGTGVHMQKMESWSQ